MESIAACLGPSRGRAAKPHSRRPGLRGVPPVTCSGWLGVRSHLARVRSAAAGGSSVSIALPGLLPDLASLRLA